MNYYEVGQKLGLEQMTKLLAQQKGRNRLPPTHQVEAKALQETYLLDKMALALASDISLKTLEAGM